MWHSDTCSRVGILGLVLALAPLGAGQAQARLTQEEALRLAFPPPLAIERRTAFLADSELASARALAGADVEIEQRVVTYYVGRDQKSVAGVAYFDGHRVRSMQEVVMVVVGSDDRVSRVEILAFDEPPEYRASGPWLGQFKGQRLDDQLSLSGSIANLTGASLTSRAIVRSVRRVLALHRTIRPFAAGPPR